MSTVRQIGIRMTVDAQSVTTELPRAGREFTQFGTQADQAAAKATRSLAQVQMSVRDVVAGAGALHIVGASLTAISNAITAMPRNAFDYSRQLEVSQVGMAGILGSMTAINGQQTTYNQGLRLSSEYIRKLNDDALRTAATSQELISVFQALLAPGLSAKMTLEEIRQLTVVGTNAVKSMGLESTQVVQELRDLVQGGITPASSTLASALGLKDSDIAKAKASSEGLFKFLMDRLQGFQASSEAFSDTLMGKLDQVKEGATRVAAEGMKPLVDESKRALDEISKLFVTFDQAGNATLNQGLVDGIREFSEGVVAATTAGRDLVGVVWENREAAVALAAVWASYKIGAIVADTVAAATAKAELAQASRLAAVQAAAEAAGNGQVVVSSRAKVAAYLAELEAKVASAQADAAAQTAQMATLVTTREAIVLSRAEVVAKLDATRATIAQAEAQIAAARAAGAQSFALAMLREGTQALTAAQARHALLMTELATLGRQQAGVNAALAAATAAQTAATNAAATAAGTLAAAQGAASVAGRALSGVVGFLGGPVGVLTTVLTLGATAWTLWGNKADESIKKVEKSVFENAAELRAELQKQIDLIDRRNAAMRSTPDVKSDRSAEVLGALQQEIDQLTNQKTENEAQEMARVARLQAAMREYGLTVSKVREQEEKGNGRVTLTSQAALQAFEKTVDGAKTASAAQLEYTNNVNAAREALDTLKKTGASAEVIAGAEKKFAESEKAWAAERDKKIKEMGAGAVSAQKQVDDARIAAVQQGYKLQASVVADGLDAIDSLRKQGLISDAAAIQRRTALQVQDIEAEQRALREHLRLLAGRKDAAKDRANLEGQLAELEQKKQNVVNKASRDEAELQAALVVSLRQGTAAIEDQAEALENQNRVYGQNATALLDLTIAQLEKQRLDLEATDNVIPGYIEALERQIAAQKRLRAAMGEKVAKDWAKEYETEAERASERVRETVQRDADQINQSLSDAIMDGGKTGGELLEDYFRTLVLKPTISALMSPVSAAVSATVNGGLSALGLAGNAASAASGASSLGGLGGILGGAGTAAGYGAQALFAGNGIGAFTGGLSMLTSGGTAATMAQGLGMMAGVAGPIALGALALNAIFGKKRTPHTGGAAFADASGVSALALKESNIGFAADKSDDVQAMVSSVAQSSAALLNAVAAMQGRSGSYSVAAGYADDSSKDAAWGQLLIKRLDAGIETALVDWESFRDSKWAPRLFADGEAGLKEWSQAIFKDVREQLGEVPGWIGKKLAEFEADPSVDKLAAIAAEIAAYPEKILQTIGLSSQGLAEQFTEGLAKGDAAAVGESFAQSVVGGIEGALVGNLASQVTSIVTSGMVTPIVDALMTGATASEALAAASVQQTLERAKAQAVAFKELWSNEDFQAALQDMRGLLSSTVAEVAGAAEYTPRYTAALAASTEATKAATDANKEAEDAARRVAEQRRSLQDQIDALTMTRAELLAKEREAVDASNRDLFDRLTLLQRQQAVEEALAAVAERYLTAREADAIRYTQMARVLAGAGVQAGQEEIAAALRSGTKEQFRALAEQVLAAGDSTLDLQEALLQIAGTYADVKDAAAAAAQANREAAMSTAQRLIDTSMAGVQRAAEAEKKRLQTRLEEDKKAVAAQVETARESVAAIKSIFDAIKSAIKSTEVETQALNLARRDAAIGVVRGALSQVQAGIAADKVVGLQDALGVIAKPSDQLFGRFDEYVRSQDAAADAMRLLGDATGEQLGTAELTLKAQKDALELLDRQYALDVAAIDSQVEAAEAQVNELRGIHAGVLDMGAAMSQLAAAIATARAVGGATGISPTTGYTGPSQALAGYSNAQVIGAVDYVREAASRGDAMAVYQGALNARLTAEQTATVMGLAGHPTSADDVRAWIAGQGLDALPDSRKFATGAAFTGGGVVHRPTYFDMAQMGEVDPEAVMPLANINGKLGVRFVGGSDSGAIVDAIQALAVRLESIEANTSAGAMHSFKAAKAGQDLLDRGVQVRTDPSRPLAIAA